MLNADNSCVPADGAVRHPRGTEIQLPQHENHERGFCLCDAPGVLPCAPWHGRQRFHDAWLLLTVWGLSFMGFEDLR